MTPSDYCGLDPVDRPVAFTVAGIKELRLIEALQRELITCLVDGAVFRDFYLRTLHRFAKASVPPLSRRRLYRLFLDTMLSSYSAARVAGLWKARSALPWWQYRTVGDSRVRESHQALHGFVARWDDPVWLKVLPLNGPCCRCSVRGLLASEAIRRVGHKALRKPGIDRLPSGLRIQYPTTILPFVSGQRPFLRR